MATRTWDEPVRRSGIRIRPLHIVLVLVAIPVLFHLSIAILRSPFTDFYITVDELAARGSTSQALRVGGDVVPGSINWNNATRVLSFDIQGQNSTLHVVYRGYAPDALKDQATAIVEGTRNGDGSFTATSVLIKCPHSYQAI